MANEGRQEPGLDTGAVDKAAHLIGELVQSLLAGGDCQERLRAGQRPDSYCCCTARRAPSATKAAAKVRRIHIMMRGLETIRSRMAAAHSP